jgi:hypothetical protein
MPEQGCARAIDAQEIDCLRVMRKRSSHAATSRERRRKDNPMRTIQFLALMALVTLALGLGACAKKDSGTTAPAPAPSYGYSK